ncbi:hypothetical protein DRF65_28100 [Chryseobacterium pennae]|uniref:Uncharacterized protein n=1 Tax=Chryseobacterium pennae TaxID=2258962 RepID=A0A3D9C0M5_9FLAO|nr:hypothetical protein DRF65_28100 [Chryseobacterium pennae]
MAFLLTIIYLYQYKDHLRNTRVSFAKDSAYAIEVTDINNYYPFALNSQLQHLKKTMGKDILLHIKMQIN